MVSNVISYIEFGELIYYFLYQPQLGCLTHASKNGFSNEPHGKYQRD